MARRCTNDGTPGLCCRALSSGVQAGQNFSFTDSRGHKRCGVCNIIQRTHGRGPGFQFRFKKGAACGIVSGCAALQGAGTTGTMLTLPQAPIGAAGVPSL
jgi:hypothetical protein